jgi:hypothetical protein
MARIDAPPMKRLEGWVFLRSGAERTNYGEIRYRLEGDTPMTDTRFFEIGWTRAPWLDSPRQLNWPEHPTPPAGEQHGL